MPRTKQPKQPEINTFAIGANASPELTLTITACGWDVAPLLTAC
jgi:hypothetical protein